MPQACFSGTIGTVVLTVTLTVVQEVKKNSPAQSRQVPKIPSKFTSEEQRANCSAELLRKYR